MTDPSGSPEATGWPTSLDQMRPSERMLVWAFRRWAIGPGGPDEGQMPSIWRAFVVELGRGRGDRAFSDFMAVLEIVRPNLIRNLTVHQPVCPCLSVDEALLICLLRTCRQNDRQGAEFGARNLVSAHSVPSLIDAAARLARTLAGAATRWSDGPDPRGAAMPSTAIH